MTVAELRRRMSAAEFAQWIALEELREYERERQQRKLEQRSRAIRRR